MHNSYCDLFIDAPTDIIKYNRDAWELVQTEIVTKTVEEIQAYAAVFWDRKRELDGTLHILPQ